MLDVDRGVTKRRHPSGYVVAMYKDTPGVYLDINGSELSREAARQAGFDVDALDIERTKREKLEAAKREIEQEYENRASVIETLLAAETETYEVKHLGAGKYGIVDDNGDRLTPPMTKAECNHYMEQLDLPQPGHETEDGETED